MEMDLPTRISQAKKFLVENPDENATTAARIFHISPVTVRSSIARESTKPIKPSINGGQNKILRDYEAEALHKFIRSLLNSSIPPTKALIFNAIRSLKLKEDATFQGPSDRWFQKWWKTNKLHTIKTKPLATARYAAGDIQQVEKWFQEYEAILRKLNIRKRRNIVNFDEQGVRIGCMKRQEILVPEDVSEFYSLSPENRVSMTIFENINAAGDYPVPPMLIMQGHELMESWFSECLPEGTKILTSKTGFTSDQIALEYLQHFIDSSDASAASGAKWKLLLMDNHGSHITPEFALLADKYHIRPFTFIPHLTHCMQPLDVGIFQHYKHYHDVAIQNAMVEFHVDYPMARFCQDLTWIRDNTFKKSTILSAWAASGMYPIKSSRCISQLRKFVPSIMETASSTSLSKEPTLPRIQPTTLKDVEHGLDQWSSKIHATMQWSDPAREDEFDDYVSHTRRVISDYHFKDYELSLFQKRRQEDLLAKSTSRKRLKPTCGGLGITKEDALKAMEKKRQEEARLEKKREHNNFMRGWRVERNKVLAKGVIARKDEKARLKRVKNYLKQGVEIPENDASPIIDPVVEFKATNPTWLAEEARKKGKEKMRAEGDSENDSENDSDIEFIIDTVGDSNIRDEMRDEMKENDDFVAFESSDSDEEVRLPGDTPPPPFTGRRRLIFNEVTGLVERI